MRRSVCRAVSLSCQYVRLGLVVGSLCSMLICLILPWLPFATKAAQGHPNPVVDKDLCYAFLHGDGIWTVCKGVRTRIYRSPHIFDLAISTDGAFLAFLNQESAPQNGVKLTSNLVTASLSPGFKTTKREVGFRSLAATCGTILGFRVGVGKTSPEDLRSGRMLEFSQKSIFRCSSDQKVVVGWGGAPRTTQMTGNLVINADGKEEQSLPVYLLSGSDFGVSPNGKYVGYFQLQSTDGHNISQFCLLGRPGSTSCASSLDTGGSPEISVSDTGEVLVLIELDEDCGGTPCRGIEYWRPGLPEREILERHDSYAPQWITPEVAVRLREWASSHVAAPASQH